jgi:hypothetical protein
MVNDHLLLKDFWHYRTEWNSLGHEEFKNPSPISTVYVSKKQVFESISTAG